MACPNKSASAAPIFIALAAVVCSAVYAPARAQTATTTFQVTATVQATCLITANPLAFGTYTGTQTDATTTISVTCTNTTAYNVALNAGTAPGATVTTRSMTGPASALLGYSLFSDAARTVVWGTTVGTNTVAGTGTGSAQALTVYGRVPAGQFVAPGAYVDTITATVSF
ncbi:spore coat U domain-containing protein [Roseomonas terrae]|jgi:spore coat protein U-like protein|uniref:Spore coat U domain-containing protein n=1 Tax=Neoroseomonas terrae TaxID=424799 RepID=A0ABS5EHA1_9PROT|nr:spore coat U domain-containing protein [Neoroseomonas terrae]MBR0650386.1 spore coat U domain-containing protein [Neoroseomonas terrae]